MIAALIAAASILASIAWGDAAGIGSVPEAMQPPPADAGRIPSGYGTLPLIFEPASEREHGVPRFLARGANHAIAVTAEGVEFALHSTRAAAVADRRAWVSIRFVDANAEAEIDGIEPLATRIHHLRGDDARNEVDVPTYGRLAISNLYPGIDVVFHGNGTRLEYDVVVAPRAGDPARFAFRVEGDVELSLSGVGDLLLQTPVGVVQLERPAAFQEIDGTRRNVESAFVLEGDRNVRFRVGAYDRERTLVIDPVVSYATYLGGSSFEQGTAIAVDAAGNAYVAGYTASADFPIVAAFDRSLGKRSDVDAFVSKLDPSGNTLVWSTYLGGAGSADRAVGIAVDAAGSAYIAGITSGTDFPTTTNAWQKATNGGSFVAKLTPAGNALVYSTYVAGATASGIAIDSAGNAHVTGSAASGFVTTPGALQTAARHPDPTVFVLKLDATGSAPLFSTLLGGSSGEDATSIAVDARGYAYVGGWTTSVDFPVVDGFQATPRGGKDAFVAKLDRTGSRLVYSMRIGGALDDAVNAIAVDAAGSAYATGETYSLDFPVKDGFQMRKAGARLVNSSVGNAFVAKLAPGGDTLVYSSFLGGEVCPTTCQLVSGSPPSQYPGDVAFGIAVDAAGHAYVSGLARSYTFPLVDATAVRKQNENEDSAFVTKVSVAGNWLLWSTFLRTGSGEIDNRWTRFPPGAATGIAVDSTGAAYVTGDADGVSNFHPTSGAFRTINALDPSAIVAKFAPVPLMALTTSNAHADAQSPVTLTATLNGPALSGTVIFRDGGSSMAGAPLVANTATLTTTLPAGIHRLSAVLSVAGSTYDTPVLHQVVEAPLSCVSP